METKHTPGPWHVEPEEASEHRGLAICAEDAVVATITPDENGPFPLDDTDRANAQLIAAAPDLLAALKAARLMLYAWKGSRPAEHGPHPELDAEIDRAEKVLAKARGEA